MSIQQELLGTALLTRIRLLRQELLGKEGLLLLSVQNLFAQSLTYLYWMPGLEKRSDIERVDVRPGKK